MHPPSELGPRTAEASWITDGPNSEGVAGWWLFREHMFRFRQDFGTGDVEAGIPVETWLQRYAERWPAIAEQLRARG